MRVVLFAMAFFPATVAQAQTSFSTQLFRPSPHGDAFLSAESGAIQPSFAVRAGVYFDYAHETLVVTHASGPMTSFVRHRVDAQLLASVALWNRLSLGLAFPVTLYQLARWRDLQGPLEANTSAGDLRIEPKVGLLDQRRHWLDVALMVSLSVPSGNALAWAGDRTVTASAEVDVSRRFGIVRVALNLGYLWREPTVFFGATVGQELFARAAMSVDLKPVELVAETYLRTAVARPFGVAGLSPWELLLAAKWYVVPSVALTAGVGRGLLGGYGSPAIRALLGLVWTWSPPAVDEQAAAAAEQAAKQRAEAERVAAESAEAEHAAAERAQAERAAAERTEAERAAVERAASQQAVEDKVAQPAPPQDVVKRALEPDEIVATNLYFEVGKDIIAQRSLLGVAHVARYLNKHSEIPKVCVEGHTDNVGNEAFNKDLSKRRAQSVVNALVEAGVDAKRLEASGKGSSHPVARGHSAHARETNRRVVFKRCP